VRPAIHRRRYPQRPHTHAIPRRLLGRVAGGALDRRGRSAAIFKQQLHLDPLPDLFPQSSVKFGDRAGAGPTDVISGDPNGMPSAPHGLNDRSSKAPWLKWNMAMSMRERACRSSWRIRASAFPPGEKATVTSSTGGTCPRGPYRTRLSAREVRGWGRGGGGGGGLAPRKRSGRIGASGDQAGAASSASADVRFHQPTPACSSPTLRSSSRAAWRVKFRDNCQP